MKALTIYQPWASLITNGEKTIETRSWATNYRGPLAIHAGKKIDRGVLHNAAIVAAFHKHNLWEGILPLGAVIAVCDLTNILQITNITRGLVYMEDVKTGEVFCLKTNSIEYVLGDYLPGRYAWKFKNMTVLPKPIPEKGRQRLWNWE